MTTPTHEEIIAAHDALTSLLKIASRTSTASAIINEKVVRAALPPRPQPTMADVEWDDDEHYLAEAENDIGIRFLMLRKLNMGNIRCVTYPRFEERIIRTEALTPTGKRYTLTEVQE